MVHGHGKAHHFSDHLGLDDELAKNLDDRHTPLETEGQAACPHYAASQARFGKLRLAYERSLLMLEIMYELIDAGQEFHPARDMIEQSAGILLHELGADLFVCRLRDAGGHWQTVAADTPDGGQTPIFVSALDEDHPRHPVMQAVVSYDAPMFVLSNDLRGSEIGGDSYDCVPYKEGFRTRLAFILRDANHQAFGLIMLYSRREGYFNRYEEPFLRDCSRIVSLTVGRQLGMGRDALAKAAGGMAHVGNNTLGIIVNYLELTREDIEADMRRRDALLAGESTVEELREFLAGMSLERQSVNIRQALGAVGRLTRAIERLESAVINPVIMHYIRGEEVLDLESETVARDQFR